MPVLVLGALALLVLALTAKGVRAETRRARPPSLPRSPAEVAALAELRRERPPAISEAPSAPSDPVVPPEPSAPPLPADVAMAVQDISDGVVNEHTETQLRQAAASAASAGLVEIAAELALHASSLAELGDAATAKPQAVIDVLANITTATASELRAAAEYALRAQLFATMAMLRFRAEQIESGRHPSGRPVADQQTVAAASSDVRMHRATPAQLRQAAEAAARLGLPADVAQRFTQTAALLEAPPAPTESPPPPAAPPPAPDLQLRRGSRGDDVRGLQQVLLRLGYDLGPRRDDGDFGRMTDRAVRAFQRAHGLRETGIVDAAMFVALRDALSRMPQTAAAGSAASTPALVSPWPDISAAQWARFLIAMKAGPPDTVAPKGNLGMFWYDPRRLEDMRVLQSVRSNNGRRVGAFRPPMTQEAWLRPDVQIAIFARDLQRIRRLLEAKPPSGSAATDAIGQAHAGRIATLSGLLAVAHTAGPAKVLSWLASEDDDRSGDKARFSSTTYAYLRATGIF